jgi:hypothetical protein
MTVPAPRRRDGRAALEDLDHVLRPGRSSLGCGVGDY